MLVCTASKMQTSQLDNCNFILFEMLLTDVPLEVSFLLAQKSQLKVTMLLFQQDTGTKVL